MAYANKKPAKTGYGSTKAGKMSAPAKRAATPNMVKTEKKVSGDPRKSAPVKVKKSTVSRPMRKK